MAVVSRDDSGRLLMTLERPWKGSQISLENGSNMLLPLPVKKLGMIDMVGNLIFLLGCL
ncbi:hypothetical protein HanRHA438_Chr14g0676921 [Helianthus annuus]|nr:hypothetical protein HanRHA438_Chr14g0676921 [Helianthus annuus]